MKKILYFTLILSIFFIGSSFVFGSTLTMNPDTADTGLVPCGGPGQDKCQICHLFVLFNNVIRFVLIDIVPFLIPLMIIIGGIVLIIAYMDPTKGATWINKAKEIFKTVIIGTILIYTAWIIVNLFFNVLGINTWEGFGRREWWNIDCDSASTRTCTWINEDSCSVSYPEQGTTGECGSFPSANNPGPWICCCRTDN
jgi:hypothetical protein